MLQLIRMHHITASATIIVITDDETWLHCTISPSINSYYHQRIINHVQTFENLVSVLRITKHYSAGRRTFQNGGKSGTLPFAEVCLGTHVPFLRE